jgi:hypothetical protein
MRQDKNLAARISQLSPEKRELLEERKRRRLAIHQNQQMIPSFSRDEAIPLSFAQQRLWFIDQLVPGTPAYNGTLTIALTGPLNRQVLQQSLNEIVKRHEILRASFPNQDGQAVQHVTADETLPCPLVDLSMYHPEQREVEAKQIALADSIWLTVLYSGPNSCALTMSSTFCSL